MMQFAKPTFARALVVWSLMTPALTSGCSGCGDENDGTRPSERSLPPLTIRDDTPNLMLTWLDDRGDAKVVLRPSDVPEHGKTLVRVIVTDKAAGTGDLFYVVDLTQKSSDGYVTRTMPRSAWEAEIERRRSAYLAKNAPPPQPTPTTAPTAAPSEAPAPKPSLGVTVIIYGASWCKPCHWAASFFKSKGAAVIEKDIEESAEALAEMRDKLDKSGQRGGSIPVIDVRGEILVGFDQRSAERALAKAASGTVL